MSKLDNLGIWMIDKKFGCQKRNYKQEIYYYFCYIKIAFDICYGFKKEITISFNKNDLWQPR